MKEVVTITRDKYHEYVGEICEKYMKTNTKEPEFEALMLMNNMAILMAMEARLFDNKEEN